MKYIKLGMLLCVTATLLPAMLKAQTTARSNNRHVEISSVQGAESNSAQRKTVSVDDEMNSFSAPSLMGVSRVDRREDDSDTTVSELSPSVLAGDGVQVAYRTVDQQDILGGVSYVNVPEIMDMNYFTYTLENMEAFAAGYHGNLWGMDQALVLVDGVPRDPGSVMPIEVAQISFLKGISAVALYGSRAAKGVILINTKRGAAGKQTINFRANAGVHLPKRYPKYLGSAEYMTLYNEARVNDGLTELYSEDEIYHHAAGENPYRYPDVDYYSPEYLRDYYNRYDGTLEIAGGSDKAQYYTNLGFLTEGSLLNFGQASNIGNERFNVRGNVDVKINEFIKAKVDAAAIFYNGKGVNTNYWEGAADLRPNLFTPLIPISMIEDTDDASLVYVNNSEHLIDGQYLLGGRQLNQTNPIGDIYGAGSRTMASRQFQFNTGVDADLRNVLKGLSFSSSFGLDYNTTYLQSFNNEYAVYEPNWNSYSGVDLISSLSKIGQDASSRSLDVDTSYYQQAIAVSAQLNYVTSVNNKHNITAVLLAGGFQQSISSIYHRVGNANLGLHLGYNFKEKYYVDFNGALIHSAKLPEQNRQAISPTLSLGWRINKEGFLASSSVINNLMLSVSGGIVHSDLDIRSTDGEREYYLYKQIYSQSDGAWYSWRDGLLTRSTDSRQGPNPDMVFPKREEINIGLNAALFDNLITLSGSAFFTRMTGLVGQNSALFPSYFSTGWPVSSFIPYVNYNNDERKGVDFNLNVNQQLGEVGLSLGLTGTYFTTKAAKRAEIWNNEYQYREGKPLDAIWGLESEGFFNDQDDIDNSADQRAFGDIRPGDIKYKDQNGDGIINDQDEVYLGRGGWSGAPLTMGVHVTAKWKGFTFFALGVSRTGAYGMKNNNDTFMDYFTVDVDDKYSEVVRGRWTPETMNTATHPRLTTLASDNNYQDSDFWMYSTNRFDLAKVQISYAFPQNTIGFIDGLEVYVSGANLLTIAPNREILELNVRTSPQTRFFNLGVRAQF